MGHGDGIDGGSGCSALPVSFFGFIEIGVSVCFFAVNGGLGVDVEVFVVLDLLKENLLLVDWLNLCD